MRDLVVRDTGKIVISDDQVAARRLLLAEKQFRERRLSGSGMADDKDEFSVVDVDGDTFKRDRTVRIRFDHVFEIYHLLILF